MKEFLPIINDYDGKNEVAAPAKFASHFPEYFKYADDVRKKNIKRAYFIFYDNPEIHEFLNKLKVVFVFHAGSVKTSVFEYKNSLIAISPLGGPSAASLMEELSFFGITEFIAIGSAGCLNETIKDSFILVERAIRDDGTSYHYVKPSTYIETDKDLNRELEEYLKANNFIYKKSTTWTNDAIYRETDKKIAMAKKLGADAVEMECASWCAVAKYRGFKFAQLLYFSDLVKQEGWQRLKGRTKLYNDEKKDAVIELVKEMIDARD